MMGIDAVRAYLAQWDKESAVREFSVSSATVDLAARALDVDAARIAKTLAFADDCGCIMVVTAGDVKVNSGKFKRAFGRKAKMLSAAETLRLTGHPVGGVCPFAVAENAKIYLDASLRRFQTVFPACGSANSAVELAPEELFTIAASSGWVDVTVPVTGD